MASHRYYNKRTVSDMKLLVEPLYWQAMGRWRKGPIWWCFSEWCVGSWASVRLHWGSFRAAVTAVTLPFAERGQAIAGVLPRNGTSFHLSASGPALLGSSGGFSASVASSPSDTCMSTALHCSSLCLKDLEWFPALPSGCWMLVGKLSNYSKLQAIFFPQQASLYL